MDIAVTGASGFIGSKFIELYGNKFNSIIKLDSKISPLDDYEKLTKLTKNVDVLVHTAFDHNYKQNISGIKNILKVCKENNIKKLIYLSTVSVYDPDINGRLNEKSQYSTINDPYSKEKRKIEKIIDDFQDNSLDIVVLQPSIVYGLGGNWTKYALHVCKSKALLLPNNGEDKCHIVYVDDVAQSIYKSINSNIKYKKILISNETISWREFYCNQCKVLKALSLPSNCNIINNENKNEFHSKRITNLIFILWFKTPFGYIFNLVIGILKKLRAKNYEDISSIEKLNLFLTSDITNDTLNPLGITKKVHGCKFKIDTKKLKNILKYESKYSFNLAMEKIKLDIQKVIE